MLSFCPIFFLIYGTFWLWTKCILLFLFIAADTGLHIMWTLACSVQVNVAISYNNIQWGFFSSQKPCAIIHVPFMISHQLQSTVTVKSQSSNLIIVVQRDPNATKQYTSNNKDAFKYRDQGGQLPACFSHSAVISRGQDNSLCSVLCVMW